MSIVGVPREIKQGEFRVGVVPAGVQKFVQANHRVFVETSAGLGSGFSNEEYARAGATIVDTAREVYEAADLIVKVKEPQPADLALMHEGQRLFTYLHLAPLHKLTQDLRHLRIDAVAYETIEVGRALPLLTPMSEIAGRLSVQVGATHLQNHNGGRGVLLGGVPGVPPGEVVVIGGGVVGTNAARVALGLGAHVTILDSNLDRLRQLDDLFGGLVTTVASNDVTVAEACRKADLLIGAVLLRGASAPTVVFETTVSEMKRGAVIVDVAIDQGGCIETTQANEQEMSHKNPTFEKHGVLHYCVPNMPAAVARTSTLALTNVTLDYALQLAGNSLEAIIKNNPALRSGINIYKGEITCEAVASSQGLKFHDVESLVDRRSAPSQRIPIKKSAGAAQKTVPSLRRGRKASMVGR